MSAWLLVCEQRAYTGRSRWENADSRFSRSRQCGPLWGVYLWQLGGRSGRWMSGRHSAPGTQTESPETIPRGAPVCASLTMATDTTDGGLMKQHTAVLWVYLDNYKRDANTLNRLKGLKIGRYEWEESKNLTAGRFIIRNSFFLAWVESYVWFKWGAAQTNL